MKKIVTTIICVLVLSSVAFAEPLTLVCRYVKDRVVEVEWKIDFVNKVIVKNLSTYNDKSFLKSEFKPYSVCVGYECISRIDGLFTLNDKPFGQCYKVNNLMF